MLTLNIGGIEIPYCQFELNPDQQFAVVATDFHNYGGFENVIVETHEVLPEYLGKLSEQNFVFEQRTICSLALEDWDFEKYPDPEIVLLNRKITNV
ncbi:MAG: hypothetical protein ACKV1O_30915 [Saprospiraceae bacterium]